MIPFFDMQKITESFEPGLAQAIQRVVQSGVFIRGREVQDFETSYKLFTGCSHAVGVGNGFDALRLIFRAWIVSGVLQEGDEVIVPANTYIASILAVTENRLVPVFVEPDIRTFNLDAARIEEKITARTRAILLVHLYGRNAMNDTIKAVAAERGLKIVEDNAQAAGCFFSGKRTGSLGDAAAHSFFPTKNLGALGDGGAVTTNDGALAETIRALGNYGSDRKGVNDLQGVNSRLDELQAAVLNVKLPRLDSDNRRRRDIARSYLKGIVNPLIVLPSEPTAPGEHVWHLFVVRCSQRDMLRQFLMDKGIGTLVHYGIPPHQQRALERMNKLVLPVTEQIHREVLSLPLHPALEDSEVGVIVAHMNSFVLSE